MKKKQATSLNKLLAFASAILAVVAVVMIFLPQIAAVNSDTVYNGIAIAFGKTLSETDLTIFGFNLFKGSAVIDFSFPNLLAYILVVVGLVIVVLQLLGIFKGKIATIIAALCLIAGGILFFFALRFSTITTSGGSLGILGGSGTHKFADANSDSTTVYKLGYGAITGGVTAICSGVLALGKAVLSK